MKHALTFTNIFHNIREFKICIETGKVSTASEIPSFLLAFPVVNSNRPQSLYYLVLHFTKNHLKISH